MTDQLTSTEDTREAVRRRYAEAALAVQNDAAAGCGCGPGCCGTLGDAEALFGADLYASHERDALPETATLASLGCGNPTAVAALAVGETVLDLGSGGGIDVLLSARRVGATGKVYGLDMTDEMLALARDNARKVGATNVEFLRGAIEQIPLADAAVDVVISNCVINLSTDKPAALGEAARVLRPGGRLAITDVIADAELDAATRGDLAAWTGCIAGALTAARYRELLASAGLVQIDIEETHRVHEHAGSAVIRARKPTS